MTRIVALLSGTAGGWILAGMLLATAGAGGAVAWQARGVIADRDVARAEGEADQARLATSQCVATHEKGRADGAEKTLAALTDAAGQVTTSLNTLATKALARGQTLDQLLKEIANAPSSDLCGRSAPELAYRRSVQPVPAVPAASP